jgi:CO/xanthine dehydrogenase Mo-binding subunit
MVLGQMYGGIAQAAGQALMEDLGIENGRIKNLNLNSYKIPRAKDLPDIKGIIVENRDPNSPTGAKGIGEPALELMAPAIANAVYNATGIRVHKLPININPEDLK